MRITRTVVYAVLTLAIWPFLFAKEPWLALLIAAAGACALLAIPLYGMRARPVGTGWPSVVPTAVLLDDAEAEFDEEIDGDDGDDGPDDDPGEPLPAEPEKTTVGDVVDIDAWLAKRAG